MQISRSEQKRRVKEVERLVAELIELPVQVVRQIEGLDAVRDLFIETARMQGSVRQRQIKYLTKRIAAMPLEPLYAVVGQHRGRALREKKQQHRIEFFRDALIDEALDMQQDCQENGTQWEENWNSATITELQEHLPEIDSLTLSRLSYLFARTRNPRYSREIFRYLKSIEELGQRTA